MSLGWKFMMPLALAYLVVVCLTIYVAQHLLGLANPRAVALVLTAVSLILGAVVFVLLDRGVTIRGTERRRLVRPAARRPHRIPASV